MRASFTCEHCGASVRCDQNGCPTVYHDCPEGKAAHAALRGQNVSPKAASVPPGHACQRCKGPLDKTSPPGALICLACYHKAANDLQIALTVGRRVLPALARLLATDTVRLLADASPEAAEAVGELQGAVIQALAQALAGMPPAPRTPDGPGDTSARGAVHTVHVVGASAIEAALDSFNAALAATGS